jgi:hypothetical protein
MRAWRRRAAGAMMLGALWALWGCGGDDSGSPKPVAVVNPPGVSTTRADDIAPTTLSNSDYSDLAPILPLEGEQIATTMPDGKIWAKYPNGVAYQDIKPGLSVQPSPGQTVYVFYTAKVARTGEVFAHSEKDKPTLFKLGSTKLPPGLNMAIYNMQRGGRRLWWIPAALAYGKKGLPPLVGPNEDVIYDIEIQQWEGRAIPMPSLKSTELGPPADMGPPIKLGPPPPPGPAGPALPATTTPAE